MAVEAAPTLPNALLCLLRLLGHGLQRKLYKGGSQLLQRIYISISCVYSVARRSLAEALHLYVLVLALASQSLGGKRSDPGPERRNQPDHSAQPLKPTPGAEKIPVELVYP